MNSTPREYAHDSAEKVGVLLVNLGTPDEPTAPALRRYLAQFLSDPRVVEIPRALWWLILHGVILRLRPAASARNPLRFRRFSPIPRCDARITPSCEFRPPGKSPPPTFQILSPPPPRAACLGAAI